MRKLLLFLVALGVAAPALAQLPTEPPAEMKKQEWMLGNWSGVGTMTMHGTEMPYTYTVKCDWFGQFMRSVSVMDFGAIKMEETSYMTWDEKASQYTNYAFTNMGPTPRIEHGKEQDGKLVMTSDPWNVMGETSISRGWMEKVDDTHAKFTLEFKNGEKWEKATESTFTKKG